MKQIAESDGGMPADRPVPVWEPQQKVPGESASGWLGDGALAAEARAGNQRDTGRYPSEREKDDASHRLER